MANEMKAGLRIDLTGNLVKSIKHAANSLSQFYSKGSYGARLFGKSINAAGNGLDYLGNKYTAILTGAGMTLALRNVANMSQQLTRVGIDAGLTAQQVKDLNTQIYNVAQNRDINIAPEELLAASSRVLQETGGNLTLVQQNLEKMAIAISATGASGEAVGRLASGLFRNLDIKSAEELVDVLAMISNQGKMGGVSLKEFAEVSDQALVAYSRTGRKGIEGVGDINALLQSARKTASDPAEASMYVSSLIKSLNSPETRKKFKEVGINIFDATGTMRSVTDISKELITRTNGDLAKITAGVGDRGALALEALATEFRNTDSFGSLDKIMAASRDGSGLVADSARAAAEFNAALTSFKSATKRLAENNLAEPLNRLANALNRISPEQMQRYLEFAKNAAIAIGGLIAARKVWNVGKGIAGFFGAGKDGVAGMASGGVVPVYVTNMAGMPGSAGAANAAGAGMGKVGVLARKAGALAVAAGGAYVIGEEIGRSDGTITGLRASHEAEQAAKSTTENAWDILSPFKIGYAIEELAKRGLEAAFGKRGQMARDAAAIQQQGSSSRSENYIKLEVDTVTGKTSIKEASNNDSPASNTELDVSLGGAVYAM